MVVLSYVHTGGARVLGEGWLRHERGRLLRGGGGETLVVGEANCTKVVSVLELPLILLWWRDILSMKFTATFCSISQAHS